MKLSDHEIKQFAQAQERSRANDLPGALEILKDLASSRPDSAMINATLAMAIADSIDYRAIVAEINAKSPNDPPSPGSGWETNP